MSTTPHEEEATPKCYAARLGRPSIKALIASAPKDSEVVIIQGSARLDPEYFTEVLEPIIKVESKDPR